MPWLVRAALVLLAAALPGVAIAANPFARMTTTLGAIDIELCGEVSAICPGDAPLSVANFLRYVEENVYPPGTFIDQRSDGPTDWFVQGGTYWAGQDSLGYFFDLVERFEPVPLEVGRGLSNLRGTISVARANDVPNSGTSAWFFNLSDNTSLDTASGGYAVFGKVVRGMDVLDAIGEVPVYPCAFAPLIDYPGCADPPAASPPAVPYLVYVTSIERVPEPGTAGLGVSSALGLAWLRRRRQAASGGRSHYLPRP